MQGLIKGPTSGWTNHQPFLRRLCRGYVKSLWALLLAGTVMLAACGSGTSSGGGQVPVPLSGNWQVSLSNMPDVTPSSGLQGGFLLEKNGSVTGTLLYSVTRAGETTPCNSGSAIVTGNLAGQTVSLTAVAGTQTFTLTGTVTSNGMASTMAGSYKSTAGTATDGSPCGAATSSLGWTAISVPPLTGPITGGFHSTGGAAGLNNQDFPLTGVFTQAQNTGADHATITGTLSFSNYPCLATASVKGQISGNTVVLQLNGADGEIGGSDTHTVTLDSTPNGYVLHSLNGTAYAVTTNACLGDGNGTPGDIGYICLALGNTGACQQPVTLTPASVTFPPQVVGSTSAEQKITLKNNDAAGIMLTGLTLAFANNLPGGVANFAVTTDTCDIPGNALGSAFSLLPGQFCTIAVTFTPQEASGASATLTVNSPASPDNNTAFAVPITGSGVSASAALVPGTHLAGSKESFPPLLSVTKQLACGADLAWLKPSHIPGRGTSCAD